MNPYIIFNGISSEDIGVIIEQLPNLDRPQRRVAETTIPGRDGALVTDEGGFDLAGATLRVNCNGVPLRKVYAWLAGEGWLVTSDEPEFRVYAYCYNSVTDSRFRLPDGQCFDSLSVNLRLAPWRYLRREEALVFTEGATFPGHGDAAAAPVITITAAAAMTLMVNGATVFIDAFANGAGVAAGTVVIDCEAGIAWRAEDGEPAWWGEYVHLEEDDWPALLPEGGVNLISWTCQGGAQVTVQPGWRFY